MLGAAGGGARGQNWRRTATPPAAADAADHSSGDGDGLDTASFGGGGGGGLTAQGGNLSRPIQIGGFILAMDSTTPTALADWLSHCHI